MIHSRKEAVSIFLYLPETDSHGAYRIAERIRIAAMSIRIPVRGEQVSFTVSIGISGYEKGETDIQSLLKDADQAVYEAKRVGRNRVECI